MTFSRAIISLLQSRSPDQSKSLTQQEHFDDEFFEHVLKNYEQHGAVHRLAHAYQFCCFVLSFFTAELFTFHSGLGPKSHVENTNAYLGQDDSEKLPEK